MPKQVFFVSINYCRSVDFLNSNIYQIKTNVEFIFIILFTFIVLLQLINIKISIFQIIDLPF